MGSAATLIVGPSWVGDMVMAQSLFKLLIEREPDRKLDVLAPAWSLPVVARMPEIRCGIASENSHGEMGLAKRWHVARKLRHANYEKAIILPRSFKAALIPWFANIPVRSGFRGESRFFLVNDTRVFDQDILDQTVKKFVALGLDSAETLPEVPNPSLRVSAQNQQRLLESLSLDTEKPVAALLPGAEYGPAKRWPIVYFTELATLLEDSGYTVWIVGSDKDAAAGNEISASNNAVNLCGRTSLEDVIDLLAFCERVVSNDSGLLHIAAAVGTHVHGIYGSSSPLFTPPLTPRRDMHYLHLDCSPCFARECPLGHLRCLKEISPADVHSTIIQSAVENPKC